MKNNQNTGNGREDRLEHLLKVLSAIRNVNQLITHEKDRARLLDSACRLLIETRGFYNAWIAPVEDGRPVEPFYSAGFNSSFQRMAEQLRDGKPVSCFNKALEESGVHVIHDPVSQCRDCPLSGEYAGRAGMTARLEHDGEIFGVLSVSAPAEYADDAEEQDLFAEVAGDISFALRKQQTEEQLRRLTQIVKTIPQPMSLVSPDYRYLAVNDAYAELYQAPAGDIAGRKVSDFIGAEVFESDVRPMLDRCLSGETVNYEVRVDFPRRGPRWMTMEYTPYHDENGDIAGVVSHGQDITERKQAEEELRVSEERYRLLFDNADVLVSLYDRDGICLMMNRKVAALFGGEPGDFIGKHFEDLHPGYGGEYTLRIREAIDTGAGRKYDDEVIFPEGRRWLLTKVHPVRDAAGEIYAAQIISQDISERMKDREALLEHQRTITLNNRIANVFLTSSNNEIYADVLDVLLEELASRYGYFGYINEDGDLVCPSMTRDVWSECEVDDKSIVFPQSVWGGLWGRSLKEKRTYIANEGLNLPDGHVPLENALAVPVLHHGELIGQFVVANRETGYGAQERELLESAAAQTAPVLNALLEKERREQEQEKLQEQLLQSQKMEAVGQLAGGIAHDFNNMLTVIMGNANLALLDMNKGDSYFDEFNEIMDASTRAKDLTMKLLTFSRRDKINVKKISVKSVIDSLVLMLKRSFDKNIRIETSFRESPVIEVDENQLLQALMNICNNARDAMPGGGSLLIECDVREIDQEYCNTNLSAAPGVYCLIQVSDSGTGIDQRIINRVIEPFFTTKGVGKGTGLGLSVTHGIIKSHSGFMDIYSESGQGTDVKIYIPAAGETAVRKTGRLDKPIRRGSETILVVDDEANVRNVAGRALSGAGYTVITADNGKQALDVFNRRRGQIDLVLLDLIMPEMSGAVVFDKLRAADPDLKIILSSGYSASGQAGEIINNGANAFIQKPFKIDNLCDTVRTVLDG